MTSLEYANNSKTNITVKMHLIEQKSVIFYTKLYTYK